MVTITSEEIVIFMIKLVKNRLYIYIYIVFKNTAVIAESRETYSFGIMEGVTAIHSRLNGSFKQFCSLVWANLYLLVVFFLGVADISSPSLCSEILDLVAKNDILDLNIFMTKSN